VCAVGHPISPGRGAQFGRRTLAEACSAWDRWWRALRVTCVRWFVRSASGQHANSVSDELAISAIKLLIILTSPARFELTTPGLGILCSILLSYGDLANPSLTVPSLYPSQRLGDHYPRGEDAEKAIASP
jgi:hypothetical protein